MYRSIACTIAIAAAILSPGAARAADDDTQLWLTASLSTPIDESAKATVELSPRLRESGEQLLSRISVDADLARGLGAGGGLTYIATEGGADETRLHQQFELRLGALSARTRLEERFFDGAARAQLRVRERIQLATPLAKRTQLAGGVEMLHILRSEDPLRDPSTEQWRFSLAAKRRLGSGLQLGAGYLLIITPRGAATDRISHVPQLSLSLGI